MNKYIRFAAGWSRVTKNGEDMISATVGEKSKTKLFLELEDGTVVPVDSFAVFKNQEKKTEKHPDFVFTYTSKE